MMFKRPRLRPTRPLVNVGVTACAIFLCACSGPEQAQPVETPADAQLTSPSGADKPAKLQAVWTTQGLDYAVLDLALSGGANPRLAAVMDGGVMQVFDLNGEKLSDAVELGVRHLADGRQIRLGDIALTLFPGLGTDGALRGYVYNAQLSEPVGVDIVADAQALGLCAGETAGEDELLRVAYWRSDAQQMLRVGVLTEVDERLVWTLTQSVEHDGPIGACILPLGETPLIVGLDEGIGLSMLEQSGRGKLLRLSDTGAVEDMTEDGAAGALEIRSGITVSPPERVTAMAALSDVQFGGYPDGVVVVGGSVAGTSRLVFVEPIALFDETAE